MPAVQTTYANYMRPPGPGTIHGSDYETFTGNCETAAGIAFGVAVSEGNKTTHGDQATVLGGASLAVFKGASVRDIAVRQGVSGSPDKYAERDEMSILRRGHMWVEPREAVVADDPVYFIAATGVFSNSASGAIGPVKGAKFTISTIASEGSAAGRAVLFLPGLANYDAV